MNSLHLEFLATGSEPYRYPLASGPEGVTLEGRKMVMAGTRGAVKKRGSMPTLLNVTNILPLRNSSVISSEFSYS